MIYLLCALMALVFFTLVVALTFVFGSAYERGLITDDEHEEYCESIDPTRNTKSKES